MKSHGKIVHLGREGTTVTDVRAVLLKLEFKHQNSPKGPWTCQWVGSIPHISDSLGIGWDLRIFINKFPSDAGAISPGTTLGTIAVRYADEGGEDISGPPFWEVTTKKRCGLSQLLLRLPSYTLFLLKQHFYSFYKTSRALLIRQGLETSSHLSDPWKLKGLPLTRTCTD